MIPEREHTATRTHTHTHTHTRTLSLSHTHTLKTHSFQRKPPARTAATHDFWHVLFGGGSGSQPFSNSVTNYQKIIIYVRVSGWI